MKSISLAPLFAILFSISVHASDYPPGYPVTHECRNQAGFEVCLINRSEGTFPRVQIKYTGYLVKSSRNRVNVLLENGQGRAYSLPLIQNQWEQPTVVFGDPHASKCVAKPHGTAPGATLPAHPGEYSWCRNRVQETPDSEMIVWEVHPGNPQESSFVSDLFRGPSIQLETSAFDDQGKWDSDFGRNYRFIF
ncbi:MAG: hypothetical protein H7222_15110 [Methylotenera sp.]|nr:hypothetical protein [Oligoflexia bacterium]